MKNSAYLSVISDSQPLWTTFLDYSLFPPVFKSVTHHVAIIPKTLCPLISNNNFISNSLNKL